jgi:hypothetical protein
MPHAAKYPSMRLPIVLFLSTLLAGAAELPSSSRDFLAELDDCIQERFLGFGTLGISRVLPQAAHGVRQFHPANAKERAAVEGLAQQGSNVVLYLAGRGIFSPPAKAGYLDPSSTVVFGVMGSRHEVHGPALITHLLHPQDLLEPTALLEDARKGLTSFDTGEGYDLKKDGWSVWVRPLRATSQACVDCHARGSGGANRSLKIGDALGVVMYVSRASANAR